MSDDHNHYMALVFETDFAIDTQLQTLHRQLYMELALKSFFRAFGLAYDLVNLKKQNKFLHKEFFPVVNSVHDENSLKKLRNEWNSYKALKMFTFCERLLS